MVSVRGIGSNTELRFSGLVFGLGTRTEPKPNRGWISRFFQGITKITRFGFLTRTEPKPNWGQGSRGFWETNFVRAICRTLIYMRMDGHTLDCWQSNGVEIIGSLAQEFEMKIWRSFTSYLLQLINNRLSSFETLSLFFYSGKQLDEHDNILCKLINQTILI